MQVDFAWRASLKQSGDKSERILKDSITAFFRYVPHSEQLTNVRFIPLRFERGGDLLGTQLIKMMPSVEHPHDPGVVPVIIHTEGSQGALGFLSVNKMSEEALRKLIQAGPYSQKPRQQASPVTVTKEAAPAPVVEAPVAPPPAAAPRNGHNGHSSQSQMMSPQTAFEIILEARGASELHAAAVTEHSVARQEVEVLDAQASRLRAELSAIEERLAAARSLEHKAREMLKETTPTPEYQERLQAAVKLVSQITASVASSS